ncbi:MAG: hypothetical protein J6R01_08255 [Alistipes sp.]|nr:hypothetical protein [Alistipes sp.]
MRDKLIELINKAYSSMWGKTFHDRRAQYEYFADYLLANGVIVPPCKVGALVFTIDQNKHICSHQIRRIERNSDGCFACSALWFPFSDFGKTVFLTREEAEAALREVQER